MSAARRETDSDDEEDRSGADGDDRPVLTFGHVASAAESRAATTLLHRYYAAAAANDGARGCALLYSLVAETVAEDYGRFPGPKWLRGDSCAVVMSKVYEHQHRRLVKDARTLHVSQVRVRGNQGLALLRFERGAPRYIYLRREYGAWKVKVFTDLGME